MLQVHGSDQHLVVCFRTVLEQDGEHAPQIVLDHVWVLPVLHVGLQHLRKAERVCEQGAVDAINLAWFKSCESELSLADVVACKGLDIVRGQQASRDLHVGGFTESEIEPVLHGLGVY